MNSKNQRPSSTNELMRYAGLGAQLFVSLGLTVFIGYKADGWLHMPFPLFVWLAPFAVLCVLIYKLVKDTSKRKSGDAQKRS